MFDVKEFLNSLLRRNGKETGWGRGGEGRGGEWKGDYHHSKSSLSTHLLHVGCHYLKFHSISEYYYLRTLLG